MEDLILKHLFEHPEGLPGLGILLAIGYYLIKLWLTARKEDVHKRRVEKRLEEEWTNGEDTLTGSKNPGRTTSQLIEIVHEDLQEHKKETNSRFDKVHSDLGKIKGKMGIE